VTLYFEDVTEGWTETYGTHRMEREAMIAFAERFDPQPMHLDREAAAAAGYSDVIASGIHTLGIAQRLLVDGFLMESSNRAGLGFENLRFHEAVYPGDVLSVRHEVVDKRRSSSSPDAGVVTSEFNVVRADTPDTDRGSRDSDEVVVSWTGVFLMGRGGGDDEGCRKNASER
jgi:acyl dehydratase